jgi:hypothetical protein
MTLVESITRDLYNIPNDKLVEVARLVRDLVPEAVKRQRQALKQLHGCLDEQTGKAFEEALAYSRRLPGEDSDG